MTTKLTANNTDYDLLNFRLSGDIESFSYQFSADIPDFETYQSLNPASEYIECTVLGYALLIESSSRSSEFGDSRFTISGRGKNALLDSRYNDRTDYTYRNQSAQTIINTLCSNAGITLTFSITDWTIKALDLKNSTPLDVIKKIVEAVGAIVQPTKTGGLLVRKRNAHRPDNVTSVDFVFAENQIKQLSVNYEDKPQYDSIEVGNEDASDNPTATLEWNAETRILRAYVVPFQDISLDHSLDNSALYFSYRGAKTEELTEEISIIDGKGNVSKPCYALIAHTYITDTLTDLAINESGDVTTSAGNSLVSVTYQTKWHEYYANQLSETIEKALIWIE